MSALRQLVSQYGEDDQIQEALYFKDLLTGIRLYKVDLVILDWDFFNSDTLEMISFIKKIHPSIGFIILGMKEKNRIEASKMDINTFFLKSDSPAKLLTLIDSFRKENKCGIN